MFSHDANCCLALRLLKPLLMRLSVVRDRVLSPFHGALVRWAIRFPCRIAFLLIGADHFRQFAVGAGRNTISRGARFAPPALFFTGLICIVFLLGHCSSAHGAGATVPRNPYHEISDRNLFGLRPPPPPRTEQLVTEPPKVLLTGITTILGDTRALLKVQFPARPSQPVKEESCILAEGQRQGSLEVLEINEKAATVKVDDAGTVMMITFEKHPNVQKNLSIPAPPAPKAPVYWPRVSMRTRLP